MDDPKDGLGAARRDDRVLPRLRRGLGERQQHRPQPGRLQADRVTLNWRHQGSTQRVKQTSLVSNPVGGLGPTVIRLDAPAVGGTPKTVTTPGAVDFEAETSTDASASTGRWMAPAKARPTRWVEHAEVQLRLGHRGELGRSLLQRLHVRHSGRGRRQPGPRRFPEGVDRGAQPLASQAARPARGRAQRQRGPRRPELEEEPGMRRARLPRLPQHGRSDQRALDTGRLPGQVGSYVQNPSCLDEGAPATGPLYYYVVAVDTAPGSGRAGRGPSHWT